MKEKLVLSEFKVDEAQEFVASFKQDAWVNNILLELEADLDKTESFRPGKLEFSFDVLRKVAKPLGDHLRVSGYFEADYQTPCVRCLKLTDQHIEGDVFGVWANEAITKLPEFEDESFLLGGQEYDLYTLDKGEANLKEFLHEQVFMNAVFLPLHDENCKGLCQHCGTDLNTMSCEHAPN